MARKSGDPIVGGDSEKEGKAKGHGQFANMPQEVEMKAYPKHQYYDRENIDDTDGRLEGDAKDAKRAHRKNLGRGMY